MGLDVARVLLLFSFKLTTRNSDIEYPCVLVQLFAREDEKLDTDMCTVEKEYRNNGSLHLGVVHIELETTSHAAHLIPIYCSNVYTNLQLHYTTMLDSFGRFYVSNLLTTMRIHLLSSSTPISSGLAELPVNNP